MWINKYTFMDIYVYLCMFIHIYTYSRMKNFLPGALSQRICYMKIDMNVQDCVHHRCVRYWCGSM